MAYGPLILSNGQACRECWGCVRHCPAHAVRISEDRCEVLDEKCVRCGLCVSTCGNTGHSVRDDTGDVRRLLDSGRPVVAVLASEFVAAMYPLTPAELEARLEALGFFAVESTLLGEEMVAIEYEARHGAQGGPPRIRSTCPVVVEWVRRFRPSLVGALVPIIPPYVAQARMIKATYTNDPVVVYVSPCYARKEEWRDPAFADAVDAVIDFLELGRLLVDFGSGPEPFDQVEVGRSRPEPLKELSLTDGYPRATLEARNMTAADVQVVRGLRALDRLLAAVEAGEAAPRIIDALNCEGCVDGPAVSPGLSLFAKRNIDAAERENRTKAAVGTRELLRHLPAVDLMRTFTPSAVPKTVTPRSEIDASLASGGFSSPEELLDCGACGYETCVEMAAAVAEGTATWDICYPQMRRRLVFEREQLEQAVMLDVVTSLPDRRAFSRRLDEEIGRHKRYGTPVSLLMIDVDGFKQINDRYGHLAGDRVLREIAATLTASLRRSDMPTRYGGDEFAVILPGVGKTDAFAVAEKLRASIADLRVETEKESESGPLRVRVSIGVASPPNGSADQTAILEAADKALYRAKESGRDQVRLAPG